MKNVCIIGGGAAGLMAAYAAAENGHNVTLFEKNEKLEKKNAKRRAKGKPELKPKEKESALLSVVMGFSMILGVLLSIVLFMWLPGVASDGIGWLCKHFGGFDDFFKIFSSKLWVINYIHATLCKNLCGFIYTFFLIVHI